MYHAMAARLKAEFDYGAIARRKSGKSGSNSNRESDPPLLSL
jgi:hypothetical protein